MTKFENVQQIHEREARLSRQAAQQRPAEKAS